MRLSRLSSIALSALLALGHSLCVCPDARLPEAAHAESAAHACCPTTDGSESHDGEASHSDERCSHCSSTLQGTVESARTLADATAERPLLLATLVILPTPTSQPSAVIRAYAHPPEHFVLLSPERLHVSLLI